MLDASVAPAAGRGSRLARCKPSGRRRERRVGGARQEPSCMAAHGQTACTTSGEAAQARRQLQAALQAGRHSAALLAHLPDSPEPCTRSPRDLLALSTASRSLGATLQCRAELCREARCAAFLKPYSRSKLRQQCMRLSLPAPRHPCMSRRRWRQRGQAAARTPPHLHRPLLLCSC